MTQVMVLCYHAVSPTWPATLSVTPEALRYQLEALVARGWRGATFSDAVVAPPHRRTLAVTFDDAFLSVFDRARPILAELGLPGTVFAPTAFMDRRQPLCWQGIDHWQDTEHGGELMGMEWSELEQLRAAGWEIGSHTRTHPRLTQLEDRALEEELERSRAECIEALGECRAIAYPYGDSDLRVARAAGRVGYAAGAELSRQLSPEGPLRWPRIGIYHSDRPWRFALKVNTTVRAVRASALGRRALP